MNEIISFILNDDEKIKIISDNGTLDTLLQTHHKIQIIFEQKAQEILLYEGLVGKKIDEFYELLQFFLNKNLMQKRKVLFFCPEISTTWLSVTVDGNFLLEIESDKPEIAHVIKIISPKTALFWKAQAEFLAIVIEENEKQHSERKASKCC